MLSTRKLFAMGMLSVAPILAHAENPALKHMEIQVENVFVAQNGFDDNDRVQVVVHGVLWNSCFRVADTVVEPSEGNTLTIRQYVNVIQDGICGDQPASMPPELGLSTPFSKVVDVGNLAAGKYQLRFRTGAAQISARSLNVSVAKAPTIDDVPYAAIGNALVPEVVNSGESVKVTLSGLITSACTHLDQVKVSVENDVIVVLPILKVDAGIACTSTLMPLVKYVELGTLAPGEYLLHVRSTNGTSVNHVFTVLK